ncbi:MFS transporter [Pigmentiphaga aceris]|nr:MFS transporter [Pigmentiphaga aceris]
MSKTASPPLRNADHVALIAVIVLLGLNLRPVLASVGPVLDQIQAATGLGHTGAGMLTTLPVLAMGLGALAGSRLYAALGTVSGIRTGIVLIALACAARAWASDAVGLILTALAAGIGIACVQTLLPAFIRERFGDGASRAMGIYSTAIMGGAAVAAAATPWLAAHDNWPHALAWWGLPAAIAAAVWWRMLPARKGERAEGGHAEEHAQGERAGGHDDVQNDGRKGTNTNTSANARVAPAPTPATPSQAPAIPPTRSWLLMIFFGLGTAAYTLVLAWLPPFYTALGWTSAQSGLLLGGVTLMEVIAGLLVSALIGRFPDRRPALAAVLLALLLGLGGLLLAPVQLAIPACALLGLGIGGLFPLSLIVTLDHAPDPAQAGRLLGFVQGGGYLIASAMPLAAGAIRSALGQLDYAWMLMAGGTLVLLAMAMRLKPLK